MHYRLILCGHVGADRDCQSSWQPHDAFPPLPAKVGGNGDGRHQMCGLTPSHRRGELKSVALVTLSGSDVCNGYDRTRDHRNQAWPHRRQYRAAPEFDHPFHNLHIRFWRVLFVTTPLLRIYSG
jgi:hypothetical protein